MIILSIVAPKVVKKESSGSDSSDDSDDKAAQKKPVAKAPVTNGKVTANGKSSSSEDSSDSDDGVAAKKPKVANQSVLNKSATSKKKESSSSDSSDSDSDNGKNTSAMAKTPAKLTSPTKTSTPNNFKPVKFVSAGFAKPTIKTTKSSSEDSSDDDDEDEKSVAQNNSVAGKKRKLSENGDSPAAKKANTKNSFNKSANSNSKPNTPFRRVKTEDVEVDNRLSNNSFDAKVNFICLSNILHFVRN